MKLATALILIGNILSGSPSLTSAFSSPSPTIRNVAPNVIHQVSSQTKPFVNAFSKKYNFSSLAQSASDEAASVENGKQGLPGSTFSLVKAIVGSGVFSLSGKMITFLNWEIISHLLFLNN